MHQAAGFTLQLRDAFGNPANPSDSAFVMHAYVEPSGRTERSAIHPACREAVT